MNGAGDRRVKKMKYGYFSKNGKEFIITRYDTPKPWINYLTNGRYTSLISQVGGGYSFYLDAAIHPITHRGIQLLLEGVPGKFVYLRDNDTGEIWNVNVAPTMKQPEGFEARHGFGYTMISSFYKGISGKITYFVSMTDDAEIWLIKLVNQSKKTRRLSIYSYMDLIFGDLSGEMSGGGWFVDSFKKMEYREGALIGTKKFVDIPGSEGEIHWPYAVFITSSLTPSEFECSKEDFIGRYRSVYNPIAIEKNRCSNKDVSGKPLAGTFKWDIIIKPNESKKFSLVMGITPRNDEAALSLLTQKYKSLQKTEKELLITKRYWENILGKSTIRTPDKDLNLDVNFWTKYQLLINTITWRNSNFYYGNSSDGIGAGGYRNILQDASGALPLLKEKAKEHIKTIAGYMNSDGIPAHGTPRPELSVKPKWLGDKTDDIPWLILTVDDYIKETGDWKFLSEEIAYLDGKADPLWQHIIKGIDRIIDSKGKRGLPLIGRGDWNDALNGPGKEGIGESVWLGMFLYLALKVATNMLNRHSSVANKLKTKLNKYIKRAEELKKIINEECWNGTYFIRAFKDDGSPVGDGSCQEGKIYLNPQIWAVLTGITDKSRSVKAMSIAERYLNTEYGLKLLDPPYTKFDPTIGIISAFSPGSHENAAVFSHANIFTVVAYAKLGRGEDAYNLYKKISPIGKEDKVIYKSEVEPYVQCQYVEGPESKDFGKGACHWLTGTAAWIFKGGMEWILGVRPDYEGLRIDPCIPSRWDKYEVVRPFRGDIYKIKVDNPKHLEKGVKEILVDGKKLSSNLIPIAGDQKVHFVKVTMG